ncbi:nitroreductase [uncultured Marivirga sp.]|uniref:nitroreductase family protein n=1 Tax=uncultured Marivirga sp. TaxID=1123707 RepID=UPI0030EF1AAC|tara:strand:+ start:105529 stop:106128 length:600 start_codon:yes stop_codon:yes gene_type:complete
MKKIINIEEFNELIRSRRSIYPAQYSGEKVNDLIIEQMLENANWAPNHKHTEPWRFIVFTDKGLDQLGKFQSDIYQQVSKAKGSFDQAKMETLRNKPLMASHVIAIGMKRDEKQSIPVEEEISAVASAVQNMQLTASAYGVGCYWGSGGITYMKEAKNALGLEEEDKLMGFLYVGMPKEGFWPEGKRNPMNDKVNWVTG